MLELKGAGGLRSSRGENAGGLAFKEKKRQKHLKAQKQTTYYMHPSGKAMAVVQILHNKQGAIYTTLERVTDKLQIIKFIVTEKVYN